MDRKDYFFRQQVTEAELDAGFEGAEQADRNIIADQSLYGVCSGFVVTQAGSPNLTVSVSAGVAYDQAGERIKTPSAQPVDISVDSGSASTAVGSGGNEKIVSIFLAFTRALSDPRTDGNSATVYFQRNESFSFVVRQGAEALLGAAVAPPLESDKILLCDIKRTFGQTQILNASINPYAVNRRQDAYAFSGAITTLRAGLIKTLLLAFLTAFDTHVGDTAPHGGPYNLEPGVRLSISSTVSETIADIVGGGTLYCLPFKSSRLPLLGAGDIWAARDVGAAGVSLLLTGLLVLDKIYNVYAYWSGSAVVLELGAQWTNDTTPADATTFINGVEVKSSDHTRRLIGCIRATGTGTTEDSKLKRYVCNIYNRIERPMSAIDTTDTWTWATANTFRPFNNSTANAFEYLTYDANEVLHAECIANAVGNGAVTIFAFAGVGIDSQTVNSAVINATGLVKATGDVGPAIARYRGAPGRGYHKVYALEASNSTSGKFAGDNGLTAGLMQAGIAGYIMG